MSSSQPIVVFTDGGAKGNPGPGGWGVVIVTADAHVIELGGGGAHVTNNQMELTSAIEALARITDMPGTVSVYADSTYVINGITNWIFGWRRRGWKTAEGGDVLNRELWEQLAYFVDGRPKGSISWNYVRGHTGIPGNERVDEIATSFALKQPVDLYDGSLIGYPVSILDLPKDTSVPKRPSSASSSSSKSKAAAFSYLSVVNGKPMRHSSWPDCDRRVKGQSGARFKKSTSASDEAAILRGWGYRVEDL